MKRTRQFSRANSALALDPFGIEGGKIVNCPIHGHIGLGGECFQFIDTPQFQRLRHLKQLGASYYVFPGASHNRFEHSLGVSYLADELIQAYKVRQPELEITAREVNVVKLAGLLHDLGHGPFSHAFDQIFVPRIRPASTWKHEEGSVKMVDHLIDVNHLDFEDCDKRFIQNLIVGDSAGQKSRKFLFDIVANGRNGLDVDKLDYIARDCYNVGMKTSYDIKRLMTYSRVINEEICYHTKQAYNVYELFHVRYSLHKQVYQHRVTCAIDQMITDALVAANPVLKIADKIDDPEEYTYLTDNILVDIERSKDPALAEAKEILLRLSRRHLYKFVDEIIFTANAEGGLSFSVNEQDIVNHQDCGRDMVELRKDDIILQDLKISYGKGTSNPVDSVRFFNSYELDDSFILEQNKVSGMIPKNFLERTLRIYVRNPEKATAAKKAFRRFLNEKRNNISQGAHTPQLSTPIKKRRHIG